MARSTKALVALALVLFLPVQMLAVQMSSIQPGDVYYLFNLGSPNDRVVVRDLDHRQQLVKIQYLSTGAVDWVSPSSLMTQTESDTADVAVPVVGGMLILGALYCLANPDECLESDTSTTTTSGRRLVATNGCSAGVELALHYQKTDLSWSTVGYWSLPAQSSRVLQFNDGSTLRTASSTLYLHAKTPWSSYSWAGEYQYNLGSETLSMRQAAIGTNSDGDYVLELVCPD